MSYKQKQINITVFQVNNITTLNWGERTSPNKFWTQHFDHKIQDKDKKLSANTGT